MSRINQKPFTPILPPVDKRPASRYFGASSVEHLIRDQFTISTWLCLGAVAQGSLFLLFGRLALLPAMVVLLYRALDHYAMATGWKRNIYMDDVLLKKFSAQFPTEEGEYGNKPAKDGVVVLHIGTRSNHPLGLLAPGFKQTGEYFRQMAIDLDAHAEEFGYLGMSGYLNVNDRSSKSELLNIAYFRTTEGLHRFAHSEYHLSAWNWWNKTVGSHPHISIFHEIFEAPKGHWENIYINSHVSGINSTIHKVLNDEGQDTYTFPVVDASRRLLKTSAGRMSRSDAKEHDGLRDHDAYER